VGTQANQSTAHQGDRPTVEREADFRRRLLDQILGGGAHFEEFIGRSFDELREQWMAPQCAVLRLLLDKLHVWRGLSPGDLEPFLEIGAFTAHLSGYLSTTHHLHGYCGDLDRTVIEKSFGEVFPRLGMTSATLTAIRADARQRDFEDGRLAFVLCFSTLHHFEDPVVCLREIRRVLRPGGVFRCAREPIQPIWRRSRKPTDCPEVRAGLIENVYTVKQYDAILGGVFDDFLSMPYDDLRMPPAVPGRRRPWLSRLFNAPSRRRLRRFVYTHFGGQDYSAFGFKSPGMMPVTGEGIQVFSASSCFAPTKAASSNSMRS
jgi:SAM-dependent methyltransferase